MLWISAALTVISRSTAQAQTEQDGIVDLFRLDTLVVDQYSRIRRAKAVYDDIFSVHLRIFPCFFLKYSTVWVLCQYKTTKDGSGEPSFWI